MSFLTSLSILVYWNLFLASESRFEILPKDDFQCHPALGAKFVFFKPYLLSQANQYRFKAKITFQTTWSEQILHKPSLFLGKRCFLNFQNQLFQKATLRPTFEKWHFFENDLKNILRDNLYHFDFLNFFYTILGLGM